VDLVGFDLRLGNHAGASRGRSRSISALVPSELRVVPDAVDMGP